MTLHSEEEHQVHQMIKDLFVKTLMEFDQDFKVIDYVKDNLIK